MQSTHTSVVYAVLFRHGHCTWLLFDDWHSAFVCNGTVLYRELNCTNVIWHGIAQHAMALQM